MSSQTRCAQCGKGLHNTYFCHFCSKSFCSTECLARHVALHHGDKPSQAPTAHH